MGKHTALWASIQPYGQPYGPAYSPMGKHSAQWAKTSALWAIIIQPYGPALWANTRPSGRVFSPMGNLALWAKLSALWAFFGFLLFDAPISILLGLQAIYILSRCHTNFLRIFTLPY